MKAFLKQNMVLLLLHLLLMVYSFSGVFSKLASAKPVLSLDFCLLYGGMIAILGIYAIGWQQIIRRMPLTTAFANKAVTVVWGIIWGAAFFREQITAGKLLGALLIIGGIVLYSLPEKEKDHG